MASVKKTWVMFYAKEPNKPIALGKSRKGLEKKIEGLWRLNPALEFLVLNTLTGDEWGYSRGA